MRILGKAVLSMAVALALAACSGGAGTTPMMKCSGCGMECKSADMCSADKKCAKCDGCAKACCEAAKECMKCEGCKKAGKMCEKCAECCKTACMEKSKMCDKCIEGCKAMGMKECAGCKMMVGPQAKCKCMK